MIINPEQPRVQIQGFNILKITGIGIIIVISTSKIKKKLLLISRNVVKMGCEIYFLDHTHTQKEIFFLGQLVFFKK